MQMMFAFIDGFLTAGNFAHQCCLNPGVYSFVPRGFHTHQGGVHLFSYRHFIVQTPGFILVTMQRRKGFTGRCVYALIRPFLQFIMKCKGLWKNNVECKWNATVGEYCARHYWIMNAKEKKREVKK